MRVTEIKMIDLIDYIAEHSIPVYIHNEEKSIAVHLYAMEGVKWYTQCHARWDMWNAKTELVQRN